jgi:hypothetical protein
MTTDEYNAMNEQYRKENREDHQNIFKELKAIEEKIELWTVSQGNKLGNHDGQFVGVWLSLGVIAGCIGYLFTH